MATGSPFKIRHGTAKSLAGVTITLKRVHVLEFEDLDWFPGWLRTCMTNNIVIMARFLGVRHALSPLITTALQRSEARQVVDLGSGAGGVMPEVIETVRTAPGMEDVTLLLSDKFPDRPMIERLAGEPQEELRYLPDSVDATRLEAAPEGLKTMVNCFHHMRPNEARAILASAIEQRQPILIYEMGGHQTVPFILWLLTLPLGLILVFLMAFVKSAFVRPVTPQQLIFTYLIPLIPLFYAWDGQASMPRIYSAEDLDELLSGLEDSNYVWEKGYGQSRSGGKLGTYLMGLPKQESR